MKKRTIITSRTHEKLVVRWVKAESRKIFCAACAAEVEMLSVEEAVAVSGLWAREIFRLIESGAIHFIETAVGLTLVCLSSLDAKPKIISRKLISEGEKK